MTMIKSLALAAVISVGVASSAFAYQVTGPILELTDSKIVVQKGKEKWELARTGATQLPVDAKVGDKVTIEYGMTAEKVEVKSAAKAEKPAASATTHATTNATATTGAAGATTVSTKAVVKTPKVAPAPATAH